MWVEILIVLVCVIVAFTVVFYIYARVIRSKYTSDLNTPNLLHLTTSSPNTSNLNTSNLTTSGRVGIGITGGSISGNTISTNKTTRMKIKDLQKHPRTKSEEGVIKVLESITGEKFPTAYPKWLVWRGKNLELDGFNEKLDIGLEFSGPLHTKWYPDKEPYTQYFERLLKDIVKKRLCRKHGVRLIVIDMSLPQQHWRNYLLSRLYDIGVVEEKPVSYIDEQIAMPYRNEQLEKELGLDRDLIRACKV